MFKTAKFARGALLAAIWIALSSTAAFAHGGIAGPDELGPPVITSAILGIVCYWVVVLWPTRRDNARNEKRAARPARR